jgi:hypothetical protein
MFCWVYHSKYISGWWYPSEKYDFVSWEYHSQYPEKVKNVPNHQPDMLANHQGESLLFSSSIAHREAGRVSGPSPSSGLSMC